MKSTIYIIILTMLLMNCIQVNTGGNMSQYRSKELIYSNSTGEKGMTIYIYNADNILYKSIWSLDDGSRSSVNSYQYNGRGQLVGFYRQFSDGLESEEFYIYENEKLKKEYFSRSDGRKGYIEYFYDEEGLKTGAECRAYKGWLTCDLQYLYSGGRLTKAIITKDGESTGEVKYTYDESGHLLEEYWDFNGKWTQTFTYRYEKSNKGEIILSNPFFKIGSDYLIDKEEYSFGKDFKGPSIYKYNDQGLLKEKIFLRSDGLTTQTEYFYKGRRLIESIRHADERPDKVYRYQYNDMGRLIQRQYYEDDMLTGYEIYDYDKNGVLKEAILKDFDTWLTGRIEFETDEYDNVIKGVYRGQPSDAEITYKYNKQGMTMEIIWDFEDSRYENQIYKLHYRAVK